MARPNDQAALAIEQTIPAAEPTIVAVGETIPRRPGRPRHIDSPLRARHLAEKETTGPLLQAAMERDGIDQGLLALACGTDQGTVSRWHSANHPAIPSLLQAKWAREAGLTHWARAAARIAGAPPLDDDARDALLQARDAINAVLGGETRP